jgi:hypothetical protein
MSYKDEDERRAKSRAFMRAWRSADVERARARWRKDAERWRRRRGVKPRRGGQDSSMWGPS